MLGAIGGILGGGGGGALGGIGKLIGGLFGGGKKKKAKKKLKQMKQMIQQLQQQVQGLKQQLAHATGFNQGMMAGLGLSQMQGSNNLACASFQGCAMPQAQLPAMSVAMSYSVSARF